MTVTSADVYFDMYDREIYAAPYSMYRRMRDEAPVYRNEQYEFWALTRFDDVAKVLTDRDTFSSAKGGVYQIAAAGIELPPGLFIFEDPPLHTIHRRLVSRLFTPRAVSAIEERVRNLFEDAAESLIGRDRFDFVKDFANMLPVQVIGMLLGLPDSDLASLRDKFHHSQNEGTAGENVDTLGGIAEAAVWFSQYLDERVEKPTDDLMSELLLIEFEDETGTRRLLGRDELLNFLVLITGAGSDTTVNAIGWAGQLLGDHPDQRRLLVKDAGLIPNAVEEVLRYESVSYHMCRTTTTEVQFHDQKLKEGSLVVVLPGSANRDERRVPDPDVFDVTREPGQIFTFSFGAHFCLGANLAKLETRLAIEAILKRFPDWSVDHNGARLTTGIDTRGWDYLPVHIG
jgi:cytochrome P450